MPVDDNQYNLALDRAGVVIGKLRQRIKEQVKGIPIGMKPKSNKEMLDWYVGLTPQDKLNLYQQYGHDGFTKMVTDMEKLKQRSDSAIQRYYKLGEG